MIHLPLKNQAEIPENLITDAALRRLRHLIEEANGNENMEYYYRNDVLRNKLKGYSIHKDEFEENDRAKCYYCESQAEAVTALQVEHYRPKARVDTLDTNGEIHSGYYWLILEWTNLLLSCPKCNGRDAKGNRFPVRGPRAQAVNPINEIDGTISINRQHCFASGNPLIDEEPLLLNPEIDDPEQFLTFNLNGHLQGYGNGADRGNTTIEICKLNRAELVVNRIKFWNDIKQEILLFCAVGAGDELLLRLFKGTCQKILLKQRPDQEYSFFGRFINREIEQFITEDVPPQFQQIFRQAYEEQNN
ncbi:HNH endonuclease [Sphingobacterium thalpophilum]|uniref:HNH endonuclease n=1 Tax=Sphingobacterium thalpophilum TaxID=259 RepID=UPI003D9543FB